MQPPVVSDLAPRAAHRWRPALWLAGLLALILVVKIAAEWRVPTPPCPLRTLTGIPCPMCGSTRTLLAFGQLDAVAAFRWNPLCALLCAGVVATFLIWIAERCLKPGWLARVQTRLAPLPWLRLAVLALAANWVYLWLRLPP